MAALTGAASAAFAGAAVLSAFVLALGHGPVAAGWVTTLPQIIGDGEKLTIAELQDEHEEARWVAGEIDRLVDDLVGVLDALGAVSAIGAGINTSYRNVRLGSAALSGAGLYGGHADGTLSFDVSGPDPRSAMRVDLSDVRALPLLTPVDTVAGPQHVWTTFSADQVEVGVDGGPVRRGGSVSGHHINSAAVRVRRAALAGRAGPPSTGLSRISAWTSTATDASVSAPGQLFVSVVRSSTNSGAKSVSIDDLTVTAGA